MKPAAVDMARMTCWHGTDKKIGFRCRMTIRTHVYETLNYIKQREIAAIKTSGQFSLLMDETTGVSGDAQLIANVHYPGLTDMEEFVLPATD